MLLEDTTILNYSDQKEREDTGPIQQDNVRGIFLHPMLAVTPGREWLGIVDYEQWAREKFTNQTSQERKALRDSRAIKDKESYRWVRGYNKATKLAQAIPATQFVYIAGREGDIDDIYHEAKNAFKTNAAGCVIRAIYDRSIFDESQPKKRNQLKASVKESSSMGKITLTYRHLEKEKSER